MRLLLMLVVLVFVGCDKPEPMKAPPTPAPVSPPFPKTIDDALAAAKGSNRPVCVQFSASWCGPCQRLKAETLNDPAVKKYLRENAIYVYIDGDEHPADVRKYRINGYPTTLVLSSDGKELGRIVGFRPVRQFLSELRARIRGT